MKSPQEVYNEWTEGETTGVRPARVQTLREELRQYTDLAVPRRIPEIENWLSRMKGQVTRKLREHNEVEDEDPDEGDGE